MKYNKICSLGENGRRLRESIKHISVTEYNNNLPTRLLYKITYFPDVFSTNNIQ